MKFLLKNLLVFAFFASSCVPVKQEGAASDAIDITPVELDLRDSVFASVLKAQNDQDLVVLASYFSAPGPSIRYAAALALGSVRDSSMADTLAHLLHDANVHVASAAAYSLGLMGATHSQDALLNAFRQYDTSGINSPINSSILEAVGRLGTPDFLQAMATVETYEPTDTLLLLGQMRGIYRYMLRGMTDPAGTATALKYLADKSYPGEVRMLAAHYLSRAKDLDLSGQADQLLALLQGESVQEIRLPLVLALGKTKSEGAWNALVEIIRTDTDTRMVCNALRAMNLYDYSQTKNIMLAALRNKDISIARTALEYLDNFGRVADAGDYRNIARENLPWQVKVPLLGIANENYSYAYGITKGNINTELKSILSRAAGIDEKTACLRALATDPKNYSFILETGRQSALPAIHSAVMEAGIEILKSKYFSSAFGNGEGVKKEILAYITGHLSTGDEAALEIVESLARDGSSGLKTLVDIPTLEQIKSSLAANPYAQYMLGKTLNSLKGTASPLARMDNYKKLSLTDFTSSAAPAFADIHTDKGTIRLRLLNALAPATVINFVNLARNEFYNGKTFHRIVPNFVIQGGCPRGDGFGSMEYSIRTETPPVYYNKAGLVGMASSGPHTESCQFFITHSPTPHLDGNYTVFAEVVSGMDVVNQVQPGDKIQRINITE
ncbi:MAG TPA: peptidylprolyl isomerase [Saprospiraceae bacterium]|nr:peptidylprolyl isomerase [Saprospiraceae bacterium]HNT20387.1 peptidylprolyl isomerase [Saprospiraceae bacterium]